MASASGGKKGKRRWRQHASADPIEKLLAAPPAVSAADDAFEDRLGEQRLTSWADRPVPSQAIIDRLAGRPLTASRTDAKERKHNPVREKKLEHILRSAARQQQVQQQQERASMDVWGAADGGSSKKAKIKPATSKLAAVPVMPTHGISYRPDVRAHSDQIAVATAYELARKAEHEKWQNALKVPAEVAALPDDDDELSLRRWTDFLAVGPAKTAEPTSSAINAGHGANYGNDDADADEADNSKARRKVGGVNRQLRKKMRKLRKRRIGREIDALKSISRALAVEEEARKVRYRARKAKLRQRDRFGNRRIGKRRFQEHRPPVLLEADIPSSLRTVSSDAPLTGNPVMDTFRHLQRRNMIPVTVHHRFQRRHAVHRFVKANERRQWEQTLATRYAEETATAEAAQHTDNDNEFL